MIENLSAYSLLKFWPLKLFSAGVVLCLFLVSCGTKTKGPMFEYVEEAPLDKSVIYLYHRRGVYYSVPHFSVNGVGCHILKRRGVYKIELEPGHHRIDIDDLTEDVFQDDLRWASNPLKVDISAGATRFFKLKVSKGAAETTELKALANFFSILFGTPDLGYDYIWTYSFEEVHAMVAEKELLDMKVQSLQTGCGEE